MVGRPNGKTNSADGGLCLANLARLTTLSYIVFFNMCIDSTMRCLLLVRFRPENWNPHTGVSKMHGCYNSIGLWFLQGVAGITVDVTDTAGTMTIFSIFY